MTGLSADPWTPVDVTDWEFLGVEQAGTNRSSWLRNPADGTIWLHKSTRMPSTGIEEGQDWAEVVATQVGRLLGVPGATTRLCTKEGRRGSLSLSMKPEGHDLIQGWVVLLGAGVPGYVPHAGRGEPVDANRPHVKRPGHNLVNIRDALANVASPDGFIGSGAFSGFDVFVGYTIFDALVANRDRHDENWAVLRPQLLGGTDRLAPSYDHGGSLGFNLSPRERRRRLSDPLALSAWVRKGTAHRFEHVPPPPSLVDHAAAGVSMCRPEAAAWWRGRLTNMDLTALTTRLEHGVPGMSEAATTFTGKLLDLNLRRLQDAICIGS